MSIHHTWGWIIWINLLCCYRLINNTLLIHNRLLLLQNLQWLTISINLLLLHYLCGRILLLDLWLLLLNLWLLLLYSRVLLLNLWLLHRWLTLINR
ncbi:MAG: hypothetical protein DRI46_12345, partial [Chloroflexi bacterium]